MTLHDLGTSSFTGKNADSGALGDFLRLVKAQRIPKGSALLVESLDRVSRQDPWETIRLLTSLRDAGIEVHMINVKKVLYPKGAKPGENSVSASEVGLLAERAHEESKTKGDRLSRAFQAKRERALAGKVKFWSPHAPWWLVVEGTDKNRRYVVDPERQAVVEKIFKLATTGGAPQAIARQLNEEGCRTWRRTYLRNERGKIVRDAEHHKAKFTESRWTENRVREMLRNDAVLGTLTATAKTKERERGYTVPDFYPPVITDRTLVTRARQALAARWRKGKSSHNDERTINLFRRILRHRGFWVRHACQRNGTLDPKTGKKAFNGYYDAIDPNGKKGARLLFIISERQLEPVIISGLSELAESEILAQSKPRESATPKLRTQLARLETQRENLLDALQAGDVAKEDVGKRLSQLKTEIEKIRADLTQSEFEEAQLRQEIRIPKDVINSALRGLRDNEHRRKVAAAIASVVRRIDVAYYVDNADGPPRLTKGGVPVTREFAEAWALLAEKDEITSFPDPVPKDKRRKPLFALITFHNGAQRAIIRLENLDGVLATFRVEANELQPA